MFFCIILILSIFYKLSFFDISIINLNFYYFNLIEKSTSLLLNKFIFLPYYISDRQCSVSNYYKVQDMLRAVAHLEHYKKTYDARFGKGNGLIPVFSTEEAWHIVWGHIRLPEWLPEWLGGGKYLYYPKWLPFIGGKPILFPRGIKYGFYPVERLSFLERFPLYTKNDVLLIKYLLNTNYKQKTYLLNNLYVHTVRRIDGDIKSQYIYNVKKGWSFMEYEYMVKSCKYVFFNNRNRLPSILTETYVYSYIEKDMLTFFSICLKYIKSIIIIIVKLFL